MAERYKHKPQPIQYGVIQHSTPALPCIKAREPTASCSRVQESAHSNTRIPRCPVDPISKMGNKESRIAEGSHGQHHSDSPAGSGPIPPTDRQHAHVYSSRPGRGSRPDLSFLGIGSSSHAEASESRKETKQEREARKAEKERVARIKERERSIKEEHVDGGFLVTMGVYTGAEDFSKPVVRQLMVSDPMLRESLLCTNILAADRATNGSLLERLGRLQRGMDGASIGSSR